MKSKILEKTTTSRSEFNRVHKFRLESECEIHCGHCPYHDGENYDKNYYGEMYSPNNKVPHLRHPNWKLVSKNEKQWMKKPINIIENTSINWRGEKITHIEITF